MQMRDDRPSADAFLAACFPLAAIHGEARVRIEGQPCPMLVEGLADRPRVVVELGRNARPGSRKSKPFPRARTRIPGGPRRAVAFLSGGVDGLHMLMRNRRLYRRDDPAYIRDALFIHGFDIGKRARDPENERYRMALRRLEPVAVETGIRIIPCRTNLRHLPSQPDFWELSPQRRGAGRRRSCGDDRAGIPIHWRHLSGSAILFRWGRIPPSTACSRASASLSSTTARVFPASKRCVILRTWPTAMAALRVCPAKLGGQANCGRCEKCLRTRLELLAAGVEETAAFGPSLTPIELWEEAVRCRCRRIAPSFTQDLLPALRARGFDALCRVIEEKIAVYRSGERSANGARLIAR